MISIFCLTYFFFSQVQLLRLILGLKLDFIHRSRMTQNYLTHEQDGFLKDLDSLFFISPFNLVQSRNSCIVLWLSCYSFPLNFKPFYRIHLLKLKTGFIFLILFENSSKFVSFYFLVVKIKQPRHQNRQGYT